VQPQEFLPVIAGGPEIHNLKMNVHVKAKLPLFDLLRPHKKALTFALLAAIG